MPKLAVGLEVGTTAVRAATVGRSRSGLVLEHLSAAPLAAGVVSEGEMVSADEVTEAVKSVLHANRRAARSVRLGVVSQRTIAREVELPWVPAKEFASALPLLAADMLTMPAEDCVLDFLSYEERHDEDGQRSVRGMLVAAPENSVLALIEAVEAGGAEVCDVTLSPLATLAAVADDLAPGPEVVIDVGLTASTVTIHAAGQPRFVRIISRGGGDITTGLAEHLSINVADAEVWKCALGRTFATMSASDRLATEKAMRAAVADLVSEIRTSIDFFSSAEGLRPVRAYLVGGAASTLGLVEILAAVLRVPVVTVNAQILQPSSALSATERALATSPALTSAVSLAMGAVA